MRLEALFLARARDRAHRQGQSPGALRVRRQGLAHHHQQTVQGWRVHPPCQGPARQSLRWSHPEELARGNRGPYRARDRAGSCGHGLCRPRCAEAQPGLSFRAKARRSLPDQKGAPASVRHRARHWSLQNRRPSGPKLPQRPPWRPDQRRHERRRLQPPPHPQMVEETFAQNHRRNMGRDNPAVSAQTRFLKAD